jgi:hypothetical protein
MLVVTTKKNATIIIESDEGTIGFILPLIDKYLSSVVFKFGSYDTELSLQINKYP